MARPGQTVLRTLAVVALSAAAAMSLSGCRAGDTHVPPTSSAQVVPANATVSHVVDGDTVDLLIGKRRVRVRLIGINTPETVDRRRPIECFGPQAKDTTRSLLPPGTAVRVERDTEPRDDYDRLLVYLYRAADGLFVNYELARRGLAVPLRIAPNIAHAPDCASAARQAEREGRGLWSACPR